MAEVLPALYVVAFYAGLLGLVHLWLMAAVGMARGKQKVSIGDGGDPFMIRIMRGQANFCENVPITLVFLLIMALLGTPAWVLHLFGITLLAARLIHGWHFTRPDAPGWQRAAGAGLTVLLQFAIVAGLIVHGLNGMMG
ncbi:MAPEG family protein [Algicella marina]|uniref:Glutathione S-transferase n=1 Tax=Algicella marina TaxID=2683284 RepID=A0A6P1T4S5_9RHOB|nr:MAPEG family protein [Algicella marina]QHQ36771.1 glutathione S-transferase [Algicella marina]